jgi:hypothetical protein
MLRRFVIERDIPGVGSNNDSGFCAAAGVSNAAIRKLANRIQWEHSYVAGNKMFCIYLAENEGVIREHARISGFPANTITPVVRILDPTAER